MGKRFSTLKLMLVALLFMPFAVSAQSLTVFDGTATNSYVPIYGLYTDSEVHSQFIYPANQLGAMTGKEITQMTFYCSLTAAYTYTGTFVISMGETTNQNFGSSTQFDLTTSMTPVYTGELYVDASGVMTIDLEGYTYQGGNLMVYVNQTVSGGYKSTSFTGETVSGASLTNYGSGSISQRNFLPKTTFMYETPSSCAKVQNVAFDESSISTTSITLNWAAGGSETAWHVAYSMDGGVSYDTVDVATTSYTFSGLASSTQYSIEGFVYADCGTEWSGPRSFSKTFATACETPATPNFVQYFNNGDAFPPVCWNTGKITGTTMPAFALYSTSYSHSGGYCCQLIDQQSGNVSYLSTGVLPIDQANKYEVIIWVYRNTNYAEKINEGLQIWATPNANDTVGGTMLGYIHRLRTQSPVEDADGVYKYSMPITVAGNLHIMIVGISEYGNATYFDDLQVRKIPTCVDIAGVQKCLGTTANTATIAVSDSTVTAFDIAYGVQGTAIEDCQIANATGMSHTLTGLTDDTYYDIYVRRNCGATDQGEWSSPITVHTKCLPVAEYPIFDNFESEPDGRLAGCYSVLNDDQYGYSLNVITVNGTSYAKYNHTADGQKFIATASSATTGYNGTSSSSKYAAYRQFQCDPTKYYEVSVYSRKYYSSYSPDDYVYNASIIYGTVEDLDSFNVVGTKLITTDDWTKVVAYIQVPAAGVYNFGFMSEAIDEDSYYGYFDDFSVREMTCIPPTSITAENVTNTSAKIVFESDYTQWQLVVDEDQANVFNGTVYNNSNVTASPVQLTGLEPFTVYYYAMRSINGTDSSLWSDVYSFRTLCDPVATFPFVEDFETMESNALIGGCYTWESSDTYRLFNYNDYSDAHSGNNSLAICGSSSTTYSSSDNGNFGFYRQFTLDATKHYQISVYAQKYQNSYTNYGYKLDFVCDTVYGLGNMHVYTSVNVESDNYELYKGYIEVPANGTYYVGLQTSALYNNYYIFVDDITIEEVTCIPPTAHSAENITTNSADITFTSSATNWEVIVDDEMIDEMTSTANVVYYNDDVQASPVALTGLEENTYYYYAIRTVNGFNLSDWVYGSFKTKCQPTELPFLDEFEDGEDGVELGGCYNTITEGNATFGYTMDFYDQGEMGIGSFTKGGAYATSVSAPAGFYREFSLEAGKTYEISFHSFTQTSSYGDFSYTVKFIAGTTTDTYVDSVNVTETLWTKYATYFTAPADGIYNVGLYAAPNSGSSTMVFDEFGVKEVTCIPPVKAEIVAVTPTTVTFDMHATAAQYEIAIDTFEIDLAYDVEPSVIDTIVDSSFVTVTGLMDGLSYNVTIRAICGEDDMSDWINVMSFKTPCFADAVPFFDDFESTPESIVGGCYMVDNSKNTNNNYGMIVIDKTTGSANKANFVKDGDHGLTVGGYPAYGQQVLNAQYMSGHMALYRYVHFEAGKSYEFSIDATTISGREYYIELGYGSTADYENMTVLSYAQSPENLTWANYSGIITPEETGDYFVCLHIENENSNFQVGFDNYSIKEIVLNEYYDTICGGEDYLLNGFNVAASEIVEGENRFEITVLDGVSGVDTVSVAYVYAYPVPQDADVYDVACEGHEYNGYGIQGVMLTQDTVFEVISQNVNGCDSLTRVHVTFQPTIYAFDTLTMCSNEVFAEEITFEPGVYDTTMVYAAATTCDSVVYTHIIVNEAFEFDETMTDVEAAFEWHGQTISENGEYTATYTTAEGCDSIYRLNVTFKAGIENVGNIEVSIVPNPMKAGASAMVYGEFENVERVEIMNNLGQVIDVFVPKAFPVEVEGIDAAGLYYVRVVTNDGTYVEKLIVE